ncbi:hypothetical protein T492DRAFT_840673 [Pavlovales sp. CCMP2436]|nr:hypothetical protein T492DRAFT_840673 [Pavlovales sp. CCMP2436]
MALLLLLLLAAPAARSQQLQPLPFRFDSPTTGRTLSLYVCAKCGIMSVYQALYAAIAGHPFERWVAGRPSVHRFWRWGLPGVSRSMRPADVSVTVTRDPIARYLSAWRSKLACCPKQSGVSPQPCYPDRSNGKRFVPQLLHLAYGPSRTHLKVRCLYFNDFAFALRAVHNHGEMAKLNGHFRPQHLQLCPPVLRKKGVLRGNVSELTPSLARLAGFNFAGGSVQVLRGHATTDGDITHEQI